MEVAVQTIERVKSKNKSAKTIVADSYSTKIRTIIAR